MTLPIVWMSVNLGCFHLGGQNKVLTISRQQPCHGNQLLIENSGVQWQCWYCCIKLQHRANACMTSYQITLFLILIRTAWCHCTYNSHLSMAAEKKIMIRKTKTCWSHLQFLEGVAPLCVCVLGRGCHCLLLVMTGIFF